MAGFEWVHNAKFKTGATPTARSKLCAAAPHVIRGVTPPQVIVIPPFLEMWLNDQDGDCVTAEEAFAKAAYSVMNGLPETKITDATVLAFCNAYGFLNGANLTDVMDKMIAPGFQQDSGYKNGPYNSLDYSNESVLQNAISIGPVKIGISSSSLPSGAGSANGWYAFGGQSGAQDHCVALCGYGPTAALFAALGVAVPAGAPAAGYLLYTWSTIGVVDHAWIMAACGEAWLRNPTTIGVGPAPVPVPPTPGTFIPPFTLWVQGTQLPIFTFPDVASALAMANLIYSSSQQTVSIMDSSKPPLLVQTVPPSPVPPVPPIPPVPTPSGGIPFGVPVTFNADGTYTLGTAGGGITLAPGTSVTVTAGGAADKITLPPFILTILKFLCPLAPMIPAPWGTILVAICGFIPHAPANPDGSVTVPLPPDLKAKVRAAKSQPMPFKAGSNEATVVTWLCENCGCGCGG